MTQTDSNREAFEKWYGSTLDRHDKLPEQYGNLYAQARWEAWQAATVHALRPIVSILHPNGIKHPQQVEPYWVVRELESRMERLREVRDDAAYLADEMRDWASSTY